MARHVVEKKKPHHSLRAIQATFVNAAALRMTKTAQDTALGLGLLLEDVVAIVQAIRQEHFYKSMTSATSSAVWQDVYHVPFNALVLYVKFTTDALGYLVISLKEK